MSETKHVPDIMEVITDLSNDEVRTPPRVANQVLDLLPDEVWTNSTYRWLDPGTKSGVFLREATKRLMVGLKTEFPDEQERLEHILTNQMFGFGATSLSALMARRALYCSKLANGPESVIEFPDEQGNIFFDWVSHSFRNGRCSECSAGQAQFGSISTENHAYSFIHINGRDKYERKLEMKFDVIIGNPPYQMKGGGGGSNDTAIYHHFVEQAIALQPSYVAMIIPSRWMAGGRGLDSFRKQMLTDKHLVKLQDFPSTKDVFPNQKIEGGVCYFLWGKDHQGPVEYTTSLNGLVTGPNVRSLDEFDVVVRDQVAEHILRKVIAISKDSFEQFVSGDTPFGLATNFKGYVKNQKPKNGQLLIYANEGTKRFTGAVDSTLITKNRHLIDKHKLFISKAYGLGEQIPRQIIGRSIVAESKTVCTQTYLVIGPFDSLAQAQNAQKFVHSKFVRFVISLRKISQDNPSSVFRWVPHLDMNQEWSDSKLYSKFNLSTQEIAYIEERIKEMDS